MAAAGRRSVISFERARGPAFEQCSIGKIAMQTTNPSTNGHDVRRVERGQFWGQWPMWPKALKWGEEGRKWQQENWKAFAFCTRRHSGAACCGVVWFFLLLFSPFCFELRELTLGSMALITDVFRGGSWRWDNPPICAYWCRSRS